MSSYCMVDRAGIEPARARSKLTRLPLSYRSMKWFCCMDSNHDYSSFRARFHTFRRQQSVKWWAPGESNTLPVKDNVYSVACTPVHLRSGTREKRIAVESNHSPVGPLGIQSRGRQPVCVAIQMADTGVIETQPRRAHPLSKRRPDLLVSVSMWRLTRESNSTPEVGAISFPTSAATIAVDQPQAWGGPGI